MELTGTARDDQVIVPLPDDMDDGTWTFGWRAISADGHPITGALTFSIGAPSDTAADIAITQGSPLAERLTAIVQGFGYVGLLVAIGLTIFQHLVLRSSEPSSTIRTFVVGAAVLGGTAWLVLIPLTTMRQQGNELSSIIQASTWWAEADNTVVISSALVTGGLALLLVAMWVPDERLRQPLEVTGGALAVLGPTLSGHTRVFTPIWMFVVPNMVHTFVGAVWLGGLIGLAITLYSQRRAGATDRATIIRLSGMVVQFSTIAGAALGLLILTGLVSGWLVLDGVRPFVESAYGRLVLLKLGLVAIVALVAAWNRFRLVPVIVARRSREGDARRLLYRLAALEGAVLIAVAVVTGFLVNQSPPTTVVAADEADGATMAIDLPLGSGSVIGTASPLVPGTSTVTIQILDEQGEPLTPQALPIVQASLPAADLGPLEGTVQETDAPATYRAELDLPLEGTWEVELIVRTSTFEEPIARFTMEVPASEAPQHDDHEHGTDHEEMTGAVRSLMVHRSMPRIAKTCRERPARAVVYLSITNRGDENDSLLGGVTSRAEHIEFHEQIIDDDSAVCDRSRMHCRSRPARPSISIRERFT